MNETSSILVLAIVGVWFFTSPRFQNFLTVVKTPGNNPLSTPRESDPTGDDLKGWQDAWMNNQSN
jgi:hypothetical protein